MSARIAFQYQSMSGASFSVSPSLVADVEALIDKVRADIAARRSSGCFIGYLSVPVSSKSGGDFQTNTDMAAHVTTRLQTDFGKHLWLVNPAAYSLPEAATTWRCGRTFSPGPMELGVTSTWSIL